MQDGTDKNIKMVTKIFENNIRDISQLQYKKCEKLTKKIHK